MTRPVFALAIALIGLAAQTAFAITPAPAWSVTGTEYLGTAVCTAGDVNGDGYSDFLVGNYSYLVGIVRHGRVDLYLGSASGPGTTPDWSYDVSGSHFFGFSVSTAGDVNGDGYDDVIIGAPHYTNTFSQEGRAYVFHGSAHGLGAAPAWTYDGGQASIWFGNCVATGGDVNGDGYDDVLITAPQYTETADLEGRVYYFKGSASGLEAQPSWTRRTGLNGLYLSTAAGGGDVNGDGYDDVLCGMPGAPNYVGYTGKVRLWLGSATGPSTAYTEITGPAVLSRFGASVAIVGDVNGDGYADALIGAPGYMDDLGQVQLYLGQATGIATTPNWTQLGPEGGSRRGEAVFSAGDFNGDGHADIVVGAPLYDNVVSDEGYVEIHAGTLSGIGSLQTALRWYRGESGDSHIGCAVATAGDVNGDGYSDLLIGSNGLAGLYYGGYNYPGDTDLTRSGTQGDEFYGFAVAFAGDVNADGYGDLLIGAPSYTNGQTDEGLAQLWTGAGIGLLSSTPNWQFEANQAQAGFGWELAAAGDVNGDGYDDVLVGAVNYSSVLPPVDYVGRAYLFNGSEDGLGSSSSWTYTGSYTDEGLSCSLASAGDVNGDGYGDFLVGAPGYQDHEVVKGRAMLFLGSPTGPASTPDWTAVGATSNENFGRSVASAGDINGDGYSDVVIGSPLYSNGQTFEGAIAVWYGGPDGLGPDCTSADADWRLESNSANAEFGAAIACAGDMRGDGYGDFVVGWPGYSSDRGRVTVYRGSATGPVLGCTSDGPAGQISRYGSAISGGGDTGSDGLSDYIVGAPYFVNDYTDEGTAKLFWGSSETHCGTGTGWMVYGDVADAHFGQAVALGGDLNGDGFGDLAVGAPQTGSVALNIGSVRIFRGNKHGFQPAAGLDRVPRQFNIADGTNIALLGKASSNDGFFIHLLGRTPAGRGSVCMQTEVEPYGVAFDGAGLQPVSPARLVDTGIPVPGAGSAVGIDELASVSQTGPYHWRARLASRHPFFPRTPWFSMPGNGGTEIDLRVGSPASAIGDDAGSHDAFDGRGHVLLARPYPIPAQSGIRIDYAIPRAGELTLEILDPAGRRVALLREGSTDPGRHSCTWDGRASDGSPAPAGVYFTRLVYEDAIRSERILLIK
jgi:hypothetical protein